MNDKLKELRKQSMETYTYSDCDGDNNRGIRLNEEKFAELIVKECASIAWNYELDNMVYYRIKEHFGVK